MTIYSWNTTTSSWDVTGTYDDYGDVTKDYSKWNSVENLSSNSNNFRYYYARE